MLVLILGRIQIFTTIVSNMPFGFAPRLDKAFRLFSPQESIFLCPEVGSGNTPCQPMTACLFHLLFCCC